MSSPRGTILLTLAQAWHALSSYVIFVTAARLLGEERFGDFGLVAWTMTTLETFVVAGVPRAVSYYVARSPGASALITVRGLKVTFAAAVMLTVLLVVASPWVVTIWREESVLGAVRISAADFVAFAGFAVLVQAVNGLHRFDRQAVIWLLYSTAKVAAVTGLLLYGGSVEWGILGYVVASAVATVVAIAGSARLVAAGRDREAPGSRELVHFGLPVAAHALALMALLNVDLWAAKWAAADRRTAGGYVAASTLARVLYFVFTAFGEALFPAVARHLEQESRDRAVGDTRAGLALLVCLLLPATGVASGAAAPTLVAVYGEGYGAAAPFLQLLAPAAAAITLVAVLAAILAAAGQARRMAGVLVGLVGIATVAVFAGAALRGPIGAAVGALATAVIGFVVTGLLVRKALGSSPLPARASVVAVAAGVALHFVLDAWTPPGWWVFPYGAVLLGPVWAILYIWCARSR